LSLLAHRILRPISIDDRKESLVALFPEDYNTLPEHFMADICARVCDKSALYDFKLKAYLHSVLDYSRVQTLPSWQQKMGRRHHAPR